MPGLPGGRPMSLSPAALSRRVPPAASETVGAGGKATCGPNVKAQSHGPRHEGDCGPTPEDGALVIDLRTIAGIGFEGDERPRRSRASTGAESQGLSVFSQSYTLNDPDNVGVLDASQGLDGRKGTTKRFGVSFAAKASSEGSDEGKIVGQEMSRNSGRTSNTSRPSGSSSARSWGARRGHHDSGGPDDRGSPVVGANCTMSPSEGGVSIMEGVLGKMRIMDMLNDGYASDSRDIDGITVRPLRSNSSGQGSFWKSRFIRRESNSQDILHMAMCTWSLAAIVAGFAVFLSVGFSVLALSLLEDLINRAGLEAVSPDVVKETRIKGYVVCSSMTLVGTALGCVLGLLVSRPLGRVAKRMLSMGSTPYRADGEEVEDPVLGRPSHIRDARMLQLGLDRLQSNIQTFECFLPETVVSGILSGDVKAQRLHVEKRLVSIMFSDIKDFTNISEQMKPQETLLLLTRYLDVMSRIAQSFKGTVAEILGDGLLVYWNTPEYVEDHWVEAATTALAQLRALGPLNAELDVMKLPRISIRVGLHTGMVLTGNIGSLSKMKFGCMGDAVNLCARLEGLCKMYKVSVVCSGEMHRRLVNTDPDMFFTRKLDVVRVKGKLIPTELFEVIGTEQHPNVSQKNSQGGQGEVNEVNQAVTKAFAASSRVMQTVHGVQWMNTVRGAASHIMRTSRNSRLFEGSMTTGISRAVTINASVNLQGDVTLDEPEIHGTRASQRRERRGSFTEIMREPLLLSLADTININARQRAGIYEKALLHWQKAEFVEAKNMLEGLVDSDDCIVDAPSVLLLARVQKFIGEDGVTIVNLTPEELAKWDGITNLDEK